MYRLAKTSPEIFGKSFNEKGELAERNDTKLWHAANIVLGSHWNLRKKIVRKKKVTIQVHHNQQKTRATPEKSVVHTKRGFFLQKENLETTGKDKTLDSGLTRRYKTFLKFRLPRVHSQATGDAEVTTSFGEVIGNLFKADPRTVIHVWGRKARYSNNKPLLKNGIKPTNKEMMVDYVDRVFVRENSFPYVRVLIGHDIHRDEYKKEAFISALHVKGIMA